MKIHKMLIVLTLALSLTLAACGNRTPDLQGTSWKLIEINGQPVLEGSTATLNFDEDSLGGNASCNTFGGEFSTENSKLTIGMLFSTMMYCEETMEQEMAYLAALEAAAEFRVRNGNLQILNADGQVTLTLAPLN